MALLTLGDVTLEGFEIPASVRFGGAQRATVHNLLGGGRVIDTMGRDDHKLTWGGILSGSTASDRARVLDAMRVAGDVLTLAWDSFCYDIVIGELTFEFCSPWWITYKIECLVVSDLAESSVQVAPNVADLILSDLTAASAFLNVGGLLVSASSPGALAPGAPGLASLVGGLSSLQATIMPGIESAESNFDSSDLSTLVSSSGSLAQLTAGTGYIERSLTNLQGILD